MDPVTVLLGAVIIFGIFWGVGTYLAGHFSRHGVKTLPSWPYLGNMKNVVLQKESFKDLINNLYRAFPDQRYVGVNNFFQHLVMITDLEVIKQVTVKDFDHFVDHFGTVDESVDTLFGSNLLSLKGQKWRDMRATLSPAFTSSKMRNMFEFVADCGDQMAQFYINEMRKPENKKLGHIEVEMKDAFTRYTNDVIASTAFGIKVDSHGDRENQFYTMGKDSSNFTGLRALKLTFFTLAPKISKFLGLKVFSDTLGNFFRDLVSDSMKAREDGKYSRPDMIQLLMEAKKGSLKHDHDSSKTTDIKEAGFATVEESSVGKEAVKRHWNDDDIVSQAILFFLAGFETTSTLLCFLAHELAINPDIQERLQEEIDEIASKNNGKVDYNDLQNMKYMDMVVSETLRMWPPGVALDRKCVKDYTLPPPSDSKDQTKGYTIAVNEGIWIPVWGIHHDEKYFPNPEKFDPERFSDENKGSIQPFTFIPFGLGPRNCIGSRFALMEAKAVIFYMLCKFDFTVITKTSIPLELTNNNLIAQAKNGFWIGLKPRIMTKM